jgi:apolipoprotein N-acyltransferase
VTAGLGIVASAAAMTLCSSMTGRWFWLGWIGLVPALAAFDGARSWRRAAWRGLGMCEAFTLGIFWWFGAAVEAYADLPAGSGIAITVLGAPLLQPQWIVFVIARHAAGRRGAIVRALVGVGAYVGTEWLVPKLLADTLGHGFLPARTMRQAADLVGAPGLSVVWLLSNEAALAAVSALRAGDPGRALRAAAAVGGLVTALWTYGTYRLDTIAAATSGVAPLTAGVVQGGFADYAGLERARGTFAATQHVLGEYVTLSREALAAAPVQLLVWPETVYPTTFGSPKSPEGAGFDRMLAGFVAAAGVPLVFGGYDAGADGREYNAAIVLEPGEDGAGVTFDAYRKTWLFPLTERVPAVLDTPAVRRRLPWLGTWTPGDGPTVLRVRPAGAPPIRIVPLVCYDAVVPAHAHDAVARGAELIVTLSNDAWFGDGPGTWLHLAVAVFRSIETHRPQVRATTTGISAVIDATGTLAATAGPGERRALVGQIRPLGMPLALFARAGDWLSPALLVQAVILLLWSARID